MNLHNTDEENSQIPTTYMKSQALNTSHEVGFKTVFMPKIFTT